MNRRVALIVIIFSFSIGVILPTMYFDYLEGTLSFRKDTMLKSSRDELLKGIFSKKNELENIDDAKLSRTVTDEQAIADIKEVREMKERERNREIEKATRRGQSAAQTNEATKQRNVHMIDARALSQELFSKTDSELFSLSLLTFPCLEIECRGLNTDSIKTIIMRVKDSKQAATDLDVKKSQAWAAVSSAAIAFLSLFVASASFWRSGKTASKVAAMENKGAPHADKAVAA